MENKALDKQAAIRKARAAYMRDYRKKNPEKIKQYNDAYWERKAKEMEENDNENHTNNQCTR